jgi:aspartate carbamoyltransferase catalytic subunit
MAEWSTVPVVNAGDGPGHHITQGALDAFTMVDEKGRGGSLEGRRIIIGGDTSGRAVTSLASFLPDYHPAAIHFVSPKVLRPRKQVRDLLNETGVYFTETEDLDEVLPFADIIYWMRTQTNHHSEEVREVLRRLDFRRFQIRPEHLERVPNAILMHPLPIKRRIDEDEANAGVVTEIVPELDRHPQTRYFVQAQNGLYVRMALIEWIFDDLPTLDMLLRRFRNARPGVPFKF